MEAKIQVLQHVVKFGWRDIMCCRDVFDFMDYSPTHVRIGAVSLLSCGLQETRCNLFEVSPQKAFRKIKIFHFLSI
jgi:hypothetical protein